MIQGIGAFLRLVLLFFSTKLERDKARKKKKEKLLNEANKAIKKDCSSALNSAIGKLRRLRK
jgi:hypothetical protein